jgi:hypothetical protein
MKLSGVFLAVLGFAAALAQNPTQDTTQSIPIQGVVLDKASRAPIAGARVSASIINGGVPTLLGAASDGSGHFEIGVPAGAAFNLISSAAGYEQFQQRQPAAGQNGVFIEVTLDRLLEIRGRLVDDETKRPIAGVGMSLARADILTTPMSLLPVRVGLTTQDDGSFAFKDLNRGDYYLRIQGAPLPVMQEIPAKDLAPETRDKALEVPEPGEGYGIVMWPGEDADVSRTQPFKLATDVADVGEIRLRRRKLHNLSGVLGGCEEGAGLQVLLLGKNVAATVRVADLDTACGRGFRILNLPEGTFTLVAQGGPPRRFISQVIDGGTRGPLSLNVSPAVSVQFTIEVEGVSQENFPQDLMGVNIAITPENAPVKIDSPDKLAPNEYEAHLFGNERYRLSIIPPPAYFLKTLSYDGVALPDMTQFTAVPGALSTIRVLLSNHPGAVEVQAPARSTVYLLKEGSKLADMNLGIGRTIQPVGADGKAVRFAGLGPGRYRAFLADGSTPISQAGIDAGLIHSTEVTVEEGQTTSVTLP